MDDRDLAGIDAAYKELERQFTSGREKPRLYETSSGRPLIGIDGVVDLAGLVTAVIAATDKQAAKV